MDHEETRIVRWRRSWRWKKYYVSNQWRQSLGDSRVSLWYDKARKRPPLYHQKRPDLPEITLSCLDETGDVEATIPVLKQRSYTGNKPVISSALADTPCAELGVGGVLERLNATLGTSYILGSKILRCLGKTTMRSLLEPYVTRNDDFGTAFTYFRRYWYDCDVADIERELRTREENDRKMRIDALHHGRITKRNVPVRRVWDLYSNRVVPSWVVGTRLHLIWDIKPWAISHAWVDEKDRVNVMTPINGREWPVPIPKDADLNLIRIEMLNLGAEYVWLDVLCLRQEGGRGEHLRMEEWMFDVPTIGGVYRKTAFMSFSEPAHAVCYFNGLGRPLHLTADYYESDRCWFRRAWTLQEITLNATVGGQTADHVMDPEVWMAFKAQLEHLQNMRVRHSAIELAFEMQNRVSSKPLDKVAGLVYVFDSESIPIYDTGISDGDAWEILMDTTSSLSRGNFFFHFPEPGNKTKYWRPSWHQVMTLKPFVKHFPWLLRPCVDIGDTNVDGDWCYGYFINSAAVQGLAVQPVENVIRQGDVAIRDPNGMPHKLTIVADHAYPIPDGLYALIGNTDKYSNDFWVVGSQWEDRKFKKLSVFRSAADEPVKLESLGFSTSKILLC